MTTIESIANTLYEGLYHYVANRNKKAFREEFAKRKTYNKKFVLEFFPKYIDFEKWSKDPKDPYDMLLINYWIIEVPVVGLKFTDLLGSYTSGNRLINRRLKKKTSSTIKIRNKKKRSRNIKPVSQYELEIAAINKKMIEIEESLMMKIKQELELKKQILAERERKKSEKVKKPNKDFDNSQMYMHYGEIADEISLKLTKDIDTSKKDFNILFRNKVITVDQSMLEFALSYFELEKKYRLEAKTLMDKLLIRVGEKHNRITEYDIKKMFSEIINQKKYFNEKEKLKKRVVWVKK